MSVFPSRVELGVSEDCHFWNILMRLNGKVDSLKVWMLLKILKISKNDSNKNCSELNFQRKTWLMYISIFTRSRARNLQRLPFLKYNVLEQESWLTLGLNAAESTNYIEKCFNRKLYKIEFPTKSSRGAYVYLNSVRSKSWNSLVTYLNFCIRL